MKCVALIVCLALAASAQYTKEALADEITDLPGIPDGVSFRMFGGYITISPTREMYYWFVESQSDPTKDPIALWTNGGPGCSGLGGFFTEQGPFRPSLTGNLTMNSYAWNNVMSMVFIEQPVGVGFSTTSEKIAYGDAQAAHDNYMFVKGFFEKFPNYKPNKFVITSESYGGHYMPTLAAEILEQGDIDNFHGFAVGNPLTWMPYRDFGQFGTWAYHQLISKPLWDNYTAAGCRSDKPSQECNNIENAMSSLVEGLDPYGLDFPICTSDSAAGRHERHTLLKILRRSGGKVHSYFPPNYQPCDDAWTATYLNRPDVQTAIHAKKPATPWADCSNEVGNNYNQDDVVAPMMPVYKKLVASGKKLNILIYSGDDDSVCATLGTQQFIWDMGYDITSDWAPWMTTAGQVGGYHVSFDGFQFATVHGAGHMVPATRPAQALEMITKYISDEW